MDLLRSPFVFFMVIWPFLLFSENDDAVILKNNLEVEVSSGVLHRKHYYEIQINNREGEDLTHVVINYKQSQKLKSIEGHILDAQGNVVKKLKKKDVKEKFLVSETFYEDYDAREFILKHDEYPYTIVYSYETSYNQFFHLAHWRPYYSKNYNTLSANLLITVPLNYEISWKAFNIKEPEIKQREEKISYEWNNVSYQTIDRPNFAPDSYSVYPYVFAVPINFHYDKEGNQNTWVDFGNWIYDLYENKNDLTMAEKLKISAIAKDATSKMDTIRRLYHYLQDNTRYVNVTIETGGMVPYPASYVCENKFGDCKALSNYFRSVLEHVGIKSQLAIVNAGYKTDRIIKDFPSQQFNHVVLYVPEEKEGLWIDCTSDYSLFSTGTGTHNQNRYALVVEKDSSQLVRIPPIKPSEVLQSRKITTRFIDPVSRVNMDITFRGEKYTKFQHLKTDFNTYDQKRILNKEIMYNGWELRDFGFHETPRDSAYIKMNLTASARNIYNEFGNDMMIKNIKLPMIYLDEPQERTMDVNIHIPFYRKDTLVFDIPDGYVLESGLEEQAIENEYGKYEVIFLQQEDKLFVFKELLIRSGYYELEEYAQFYEFYKKVKKSESKPLFLLSRKTK